MAESTAKTFPLKFPFEFRGGTYIQFTARRPKVRDLRQFIKNADKGVEALETTLANLCEIDGAIIAEIDVEDFAPMKKWFEDFLKPMMGGSDE